MFEVDIFGLERDNVVLFLIPKKEDGSKNCH
jgi:hypothetical protein